MRLPHISSVVTRTQPAQRFNFANHSCSIASTDKPREELKDLLDFMHGFPAPLARCSDCGLLVRGEQRVPEANSFEKDRNDLDLMAHVARIAQTQAQFIRH